MKNRNNRSVRFAQFLNQYEASGYAGSQGYDVENLRQLSGEEKLVVERLLIARMAKNDTRIPSALVAVNSGKALEALQRKLLEVKPPHIFHAVVCKALWEITKSKEFQKALIDDLTIENELFRINILIMLGEMVPDNESVSRLKQLLKADPSHRARAAAGRTLLFWAGKIENPNSLDHQFRNLNFEIINSDEKTSQVGVERLLKLIET